MFQPDVERPARAIGNAGTDATGSSETRVYYFSEVDMATRKQDTTELTTVLKSVRTMPQDSTYDLVETLWEKQAKQEFVDLLLNWGDIDHKFKLLRAAAERVMRERETPNKLAVAICVNIVTKSPDVISYLWKGGAQPTVLHVATLAESSELVDAIFDKALEIDGFDKLLEVKDQRGYGKTPLRAAVEARLPHLVRRILQRDKNPIGDPNLLRWVINEKDTSAVLQVLIQERPRDMTDSVVEHVLDTKDDKLIQALQDSEECHNLFERRGFLHKMVQKGDRAIVDKLLDKFPKLALELDNKNEPVLSYNDNNKSDDKKHIRDKIVRLIIRQISSVDQSQYRCLFSDDVQSPNQPNPRASEIVRALIARPSEKRQEISLSLGGFGSWASSAQSFLNLIRGSQTSKQPKEQPLQALLQVGFEHTLIYVDIPVSDLPVPRRSARVSLKRLEVSEILRWLNGDKKVTGIYELSVRDSCYLPHNEHVIRTCLTIFDVEVLDWRRLDLSLRVLHAPKETTNLVCPNLKTLRLYAGGWPALAYWTSDESLSFLSGFPKLIQVDIFILKEFVGEPLCEDYKNEASARFDTFKTNHSDSKLQVTPTIKSWSDLNPPEEKPNPPRETTPAEVTRLGNFLEAYDRLHRDFADSHWRSERLGGGDLDPTGQHTPYVKVAVIDNGVDPGSINCHGISGASFVPSETGESNWWYIRHPHGTKMARIITELNPYCHLLVVKVCEGRSDATASRVTRALEWAVAAGAHVVSLSLTLDEYSGKLQIAINEAVASGVAVVASVRGEGNDGKGAGFPEKYQGVLAIASADSQGAPSKGTIDGEAKYLFRGEKIVARTEFLGGLEDSPDISGPSVATAIAAGVASLVLACDRFALSCHRAKAETWRQHEKLGGQIVENIFKKMELNRYVRPWVFFAEDKAKPTWGEGDSVLKWIGEKFKDLLPVS